MPGGGQPIVVGGGIQLTGGAINEYLFLTSITPPTATTSPRIRIITSTNPNQIAAETLAAREDTVIGIGSSNGGIAAGQIRPDVIIGRNITVSHGNSGANNAGVFIGQGYTSSAGSGANNVIIGPGHTQNGGTSINSQNVIIGTGTFQNGQSSSVLIGGTVTANANTGVIAIGQGATVNANNAVVIGQGAAASQGNNVSIGQGVTTTAIASIAIGQGHGCPNRDMIKIGHGGQNAGTAGQILIGNGIDPNSVGAGEICFGNNGLGGGSFSVGVRWGQNQHTSGVAVPAWNEIYKSALGTDINAGDVTTQLPRATGNAAGASWIIQTTVPGASGATLQTLAEVARFAPGTATEPRHFQISVNKGLWFTNQTDGAGAGAGTLTNAPTAGDPTFWLPVRINGVDLFIPCWP